MATTTASVAPNNSTDAEFRAWAQFVHDVFSNGGWVQTADTGQIDLATVAKPAAANTKQGYEIWRMDDAAQSTHPVFLKLAYGSAANALYPGIWFAVGTATDGAGNIVSAIDGLSGYLIDEYSRSTPAIPLFGNNSSAAFASFGSADTDRAVFALFEGKPVVHYAGTTCDFVSLNATDTSGQQLLFSIERGRDASGNVDAEHLIVLFTGTATVVNSSYYVKTDDAWVPAIKQFGAGTSMVPLSTVETIWLNALDIMLPDDGTAYPVILSQQDAKPAWPGINVLFSKYSLYKFADPGSDCSTPVNSSYISGRTAAVTPYGTTTRTYRTVAGLRGPVYCSNTAASQVYVWILFE